VLHQWIHFLHIASALGFVGVHGASIVVLYAIRNESDRGRIENLLGFSAKTVVAMYLSLVLVVGTGFWAGFAEPEVFGQAWFWWSLVILALTTVLMWFVARPFGKRVLAACEIRPSGVPRVSDEELAQILRSQRTNLITLIGVGGLGAILYLMIFKPGL
jgi:cation transport ATPase